jgi:hypothetical protein
LLDVKLMSKLKLAINKLILNKMKIFRKKKQNKKN